VRCEENWGRGRDWGAACIHAPCSTPRKGKGKFLPLEGYSACLCSSRVKMSVKWLFHYNSIHFYSTVQVEARVLWPSKGKSFPLYPSWIRTANCRPILLLFLLMSPAIYYLPRVCTRCFYRKHLARMHYIYSQVPGVYYIIFPDVERALPLIIITNVSIDHRTIMLRMLEH
jgi:hypothetical protein